MSLTPAKRSTIKHLLNVGSVGTEQYALINEGVTELTEDFNADTEDLQYVAEDSATTVVKRYAPSISLSAVLVEKDGENPDEVNKWISEKVNTLPIGSNADTSYIRFSLLDEVGTGTATQKTYTAYKRNAVVSIGNVGGSAGDNVGMEVELHGKGDQIKGTLTLAITGTGTDQKTTYTFTPDSPTQVTTQSETYSMK